MQNVDLQSQLSNQFKIGNKINPNPFVSNKVYERPPKYQQFKKLKN